MVCFGSTASSPAEVTNSPFDCDVRRTMPVTTTRLPIFGTSRFASLDPETLLISRQEALRALGYSYADIRTARLATAFDS